MSSQPDTERIRRDLIRSLRTEGYRINEAIGEAVDQFIDEIEEIREDYELEEFEDDDDDDDAH